MQGGKCLGFGRSVETMTLSECVVELESLDRFCAALPSHDAADGPGLRRTDLEGRRARLLDALRVRPAQSSDDALAKFRWVLYEANGKMRPAAVPANDLVLVMQQVAAFPR